MVRCAATPGPDGWPLGAAPFSVAAGDAITLTTRADLLEPADGVLPVTYDRLHEMCAPGDTLYIARYLVCGADDSASLYLRVTRVDGADVVCEAQNDAAALGGVLTVFHMERSADGLSNVQNDQPLMTDGDKAAIVALGREFEVDFVALAYTRCRFVRVSLV
jgi:pyruvate kinase